MYVCIWCMFVFMSVVVTVWGLWEVCCVAAVVKNNVFLALECCSMFMMDVVFSVCIVRRGAYKRWSCHSRQKLLCKLCRTFPPQWGPDLYMGNVVVVGYPLS